METITSDIVIEIQDGKKFVCNDDNQAKGKAVRSLMENLGWKFLGEINKNVHGQDTTVAKYQR